MVTILARLGAAAAGFGVVGLSNEGETVGVPLEGTSEWAQQTHSNLYQASHTQAHGVVRPTLG